MDWEIATPKKKKYKLFFWGPEGCYKTRTALRLGNVPDSDKPAMAVIDTEFGTDHYGGEFRFRRKQTVDPDEVFQSVKDLIKSPNGIKTLVIDSFSVYYQSLVSKYADLFLKREVTSSGNKKDYYVIQPRDYQAINREAYNFVRMLLACDFNVIATCHAKDKWGEGMKVEGKIPDGPKKMAHYFDTVVEIEDAKGGGFQGVVKRKDRTHSLQVQKVIPWNSDKDAADYISNAFGHDLSIDAVVKPGQVINVKTTGTKKDKTEKEIPEKQVIEKETNDPVINESQPIENESTEIKPSESESVVDQYKSLLSQVVALKKELRIVDKKDWMNLIMPFNVNSAKEMDNSQLQQFIKNLEDMRPIESPAV